MGEISILLGNVFLPFLPFSEGVKDKMGKKERKMSA